jgi:site-specific recombinase XerD
MKRSRASSTLDKILEVQVQRLAPTLRPRTVEEYRSCARGFLAYLHAHFPRIRKLSQLRRDPHLLGWFRYLCQQQPPLRNATRELNLILLRRLFRDLTNRGQRLQPDLIRREDFPLRDHYLPRPLPPDQDQRLQQQLRQSNTLEALALRLIRATGIRVGECLDLRLDCLRQVSEQEAALHVPLGKLHSERWVPVDEETQRVLERLLQLRALAPASCLAKSRGFLLPRCGGRGALYDRLRQVLVHTAGSAGCSGKVTPHRLRHSYATEMVRLGVSLPVLMQLLGHRNILMTMRYVQVAQLDVQREFHRALQNTTSLYAIPQLPMPDPKVPQHVDLAALRHAVAATHHLFQLLQPQLEDRPRRKLRRLSQRLLKILPELDNLTPK